MFIHPPRFGVFVAIESEQRVTRISPVFINLALEAASESAGNTSFLFLSLLLQKNRPYVKIALPARREGRSS